MLLEKVEDLKRAIQRLTLLQSHDTLCLLRNVLVMPNLLYIFVLHLQHETISTRDLTIRFVKAYRRSWMSNFHDDQGTHASLPVQMGGLGVPSMVMLAPSVYLASAAATLPLQNAILNDSLPTTLGPYIGEALDLWRELKFQKCQQIAFRENGILESQPLCIRFCFQDAWAK